MSVLFFSGALLCYSIILGATRLIVLSLLIFNKIQGKFNLIFLYSMVSNSQWVLSEGLIDGNTTW